MRPTPKRMSWSGVGPKMAAVAFPALALAIALAVAGVSLPLPITPRAGVALGAPLLALGIVWWIASGVHFVRHFDGRSLVTTGPYAWCRHPIYASAIVFVLPATALLVHAWSFLLVDLLLWGAFRVFIGGEDLELARRFGAAYDLYRQEVPELLPRPAWVRRPRPLVTPSARLDAWLSGAPFRDTIVVAGHASPGALMAAIQQVTLRDMPLASTLGRLRYAAGKPSATLDPGAPFLSGLAESRGTLILERTPDELVIATVGKLHQVRDQQMADLRTPQDFVSFSAPDHDKLVVSIRALRAEEGESLLVLEHRTRATDDVAERRFARYWIAIRPGGAFVTRQLLRAAVRLAERAGRRSGHAHGRTAPSSAIPG